MDTAPETMVYDKELQIEAYCFKGILQPFPNHFHEHYVIGFVENGKRLLSCKNENYIIQGGSTLLFNAGDNHTCAQMDHTSFDYLSLNITQEIMSHLTKEATGQNRLPVFSPNVIQDEEIASYLCQLHRMIVEHSAGFQKEETLLLLMSMLIQRYDRPFANHFPENPEHYSQAVALACTFMEDHFSEQICLKDICHSAGMSKSTLLRAFTKIRGVTPYRYLETLRINEAKKLLQCGISPAETALRTGFSDQSHFSNYFHQFIGLSPGSYREIFLDKSERERTHHEE